MDAYLLLQFQWRCDQIAGLSYDSRYYSHISTVNDHGRRESTGWSKEVGDSGDIQSPVVPNDVITKPGAKCKSAQHRNNNPVQSLRPSPLYQRQLRPHFQGLCHGSSRDCTSKRDSDPPVTTGDEAQKYRLCADQTRAVLFWMVDVAFVWWRQRHREREREQLKWTVSRIHCIYST